MQGSFLKRLHVRVFWGTDARNQEGHFDRCTQQTFEQQILARYGANPGCRHESSGTPAMDLRHGKPIMFVCVMWYVCVVETHSFSSMFLSFFLSYLTWRFNLMRSLGFWFLVCYADTQLALQLQQEHIQVVRSKPQNPDWIERHSRNGPWTHEFVLKWCMSTLEVDLETIVAIIMIIIDVLLLSFFLSWGSKTQPNHWTTRLKRMVSTRLIT